MAPVDEPAEPAAPAYDRYTAFLVVAETVDDLVANLKACDGAALSLAHLTEGCAESTTRELVRITLAGVPLCTIRLEV